VVKLDICLRIVLSTFYYILIDILYNIKILYFYIGNNNVVFCILEKGSTIECAVIYSSALVR